MIAIVYAATCVGLLAFMLLYFRWHDKRDRREMEYSKAMNRFRNDVLYNAQLAGDRLGDFPETGGWIIR